MKILAPILTALVLCACTPDPKDVSAVELLKDNQKWHDTYVRTCGLVLAATCRLKVCPEGTPLPDVPQCSAISEIHLSTTSAVCPSSGRDFWAHIDGRFIALEPGGEFNDKNRFVIGKANVGPVNEPCLVPRSGT